MQIISNMWKHVAKYIVFTHPVTSHVIYYMSSTLTNSHTSTIYSNHLLLLLLGKRFIIENQCLTFTVENLGNPQKICAICSGTMNI